MPMPNQRFHIYAQSDSRNNEAVFVLHCTALYSIVLQTLVGRDGGLHALLFRGHEYVGYTFKYLNH